MKISDFGKKLRDRIGLYYAFEIPSNIFGSVNGRLEDGLEDGRERNFFKYGISLGDDLMPK